MKMHVHVYRVNGLVENDVEADTQEKAMKAALTMAASMKPEEIGLPDCKFVAVVPAAMMKIPMLTRLGHAFRFAYGRASTSEVE